MHAVETVKAVIGHVSRAFPGTATYDEERSSISPLALPSRVAKDFGERHSAEGLAVRSLVSCEREVDAASITRFSLKPLPS